MEGAATMKGIPRTTRLPLSETQAMHAGLGVNVRHSTPIVEGKSVQQEVTVPLYSRQSSGKRNRYVRG